MATEDFSMRCYNDLFWPVQALKVGVPIKSVYMTTHMNQLSSPHHVSRGGGSVHTAHTTWSPIAAVR